jgi:hypothetical protein
MSICHAQVLYVAHVGDSGAVMACKSYDISFPLRLTKDHKPNRPDEHARIKHAGGRIDEGRNRVYQEKPHNNRITLLSMSRCLLYGCSRHNHFGRLCVIMQKILLAWTVWFWTLPCSAHFLVLIAPLKLVAEGGRTSQKVEHDVSLLQAYCTVTSDSLSRSEPGHWEMPHSSWGRRRTRWSARRRCGVWSCSLATRP